MKFYIKLLREVLTMTKQLPTGRFVALVLVAAMYGLLFGSAALVSAVRWW